MNLDIYLKIKSMYNQLGKNKTLEDIISETQETNTSYISFISPEGSFRKYCNKNKILDNYYIRGIFDLSTIFSFDTNVKFSLFILSETKSDYIKTGVYNSFIKLNKNDSSNIILPIDFVEYCTQASKWINTDCKTPNDTETYEFNLISYDSFNKNFPTAERYKKEVLKTLKLLEKENTVPLCTLADIIIPKRIDITEGKSITRQCLKYPFNYSGIKNVKVSDVQVKKGDIIILNDLIYLLNDDIDNVYLNSFMQLIRPKNNISSEYLYIYLISDTAKTIISNKSLGSVIKRISKQELESLPIILPPKDTEKYKDIFIKLYFKQNDTTINELTSIIPFLKKDEETLENILLSEQLPKLTLIKNNKVRSLISDDIKELEICYKHKAYKSTLILAGSILEAFLIDWVGTINHKDYFSEDYFVQDKYNPYKSKRADLIDYIDSIKELKRPSWMSEAEKAHTIRKKRNMVHAKLCMNQSHEINAQTCRMVIDSLIEIISTRFWDIKK